MTHRYNGFHSSLTTNKELSSEEDIEMVVSIQLFILHTFLDGLLYGFIT